VVEVAEGVVGHQQMEEEVVEEGVVDRLKHIRLVFAGLTE
jgi:hypothetical protein